MTWWYWPLSMNQIRLLTMTMTIDVAVTWSLRITWILNLRKPLMTMTMTMNLNQLWPLMTTFLRLWPSRSFSLKTSFFVFGFVKQKTKRKKSGIFGALFRGAFFLTSAVADASALRNFSKNDCWSKTRLDKFCLYTNRFALISSGKYTLVFCQLFAKIWKLQSELQHSTVPPPSGN